MNLVVLLADEGWEWCRLDLVGVVLDADAVEVLRDHVHVPAEALNVDSREFGRNVLVDDTEDNDYLILRDRVVVARPVAYPVVPPSRRRGEVPVVLGGPRTRRGSDVPWTENVETDLVVRRVEASEKLLIEDLLCEGSGEGDGVCPVLDQSVGDTAGERGDYLVELPLKEVSFLAVERCGWEALVLSFEVELRVWTRERASEVELSCHGSRSSLASSTENFRCHWSYQNYSSSGSAPDSGAST